MATNKEKPTKDFESTKTFKQTVSSNLESYACLWLDQNINSTQDNRDTHQELRQVINHLRAFDSNDKCEKYIQQITQEKVILIVSGSAGRQIVPRIHDLPQLSACYIFRQDKKANEQWASKYHKLNYFINGVFIERAKLVTQIANDQAARIKVEDGAAIAVISSGSQSLQARNAIFMWFQLFIKVPLSMHHRSTDRKELLDICKKNYKGNQQEMKIIHKFEKKYKSEDAIRWYTRESCFYRMLNKALRVQDFDMLFIFRFFITDIAKQLKSKYEKFIRTSDSRNLIHVYRGQAINVVELELMKNSIGEYLSMNSFLSTSRDRSIALDFVRSTPVINEIERIIFEIKIDPHLQIKAFANVTSISYYQHEDEVLTMLGALFHIDEVIEDKKDRVWIACVSLASEDDYHLKETFGYMKQMIGDDTDLDSLGKILYEMGEYEQGQKCYERMMHDLQVKTTSCHVGLGKALDWQEQFELALSHYNQAMKIRQDVLGSQHESVGEVYTYIGGTHWYVLHDYDQALINLKQAIEIQEKTLQPDSLDLVSTYDYIAATYDQLKQYDFATKYYEKALRIRQSVLPPEHPLTANTYNNLGKLYHDTGDYRKALEYYKKSLDIRSKILPPSHPDFALTKNNIRLLKNMMKE